MKDIKSRLRRRYGEVASYISILSDKSEVPWVPLTIGEYLKSIREVGRSPELVEDDIFTKCVKNEYLVKNLDSLKAGTIETVVRGILNNSAPSTIEDFNIILNFYRYQIDASIYDQLVIMICDNFNYTPREVYSMHLEEFMHTVALAERRMLENGSILEPIVIEDKQQIEQQHVQQKNESKNLKDLYEQQYGNREKPSPPPPPQSPQASGNAPDFVVTQELMYETKAAATAHELKDYDVLQEEMMKETLQFYPEYIEMMKEHGKITPDMIKTPSERKEEALKRMKENEKENIVKMHEKMTAEKKEEERLGKLFKKGQGRRRKTNRR